MRRYFKFIIIGLIGIVILVGCSNSTKQEDIMLEEGKHVSGQDFESDKMYNIEIIEGYGNVYSLESDDYMSAKDEEFFNIVMGTSEFRQKYGNYVVDKWSFRLKEGRVLYLEGVKVKLVPIN